MDLFYYLLIIFGPLILGYLIVLLFTSSKKKEEEARFRKEQEERLADERIYDPISGQLLTIEEAESGHFVKHVNETRIIPESELQQFYNEDLVIVQRCFNFLKKEGGKLVELSEEVVEMVDNTRTFLSHPNWGTEQMCSFESSLYFLFPHVENGFANADMQTSGYMSIAVIVSGKDYGEYQAKPKSNVEMLLGKTFSKEDRFIANHILTTHRKEANEIHLINILGNSIQPSYEPSLEIEVHTNLIILSDHTTPSPKSTEIIYRIARHMLARL